MSRALMRTETHRNEKTIGGPAVSPAVSNVPWAAGPLRRLPEC